MNRSTTTMLAVLVALPLAISAPQAQTLTVGLGAPVTTIDPHFHNVGPNNALTNHIFDRLVTPLNVLHNSLQCFYKSIYILDLIM